MLPANFRLRLDGPVTMGGEPFALHRFDEADARCIEAWRDGAPVGSRRTLARALVRANLAQPVPPPGPHPPVSVVIPVRDRSIARLLDAVEVDEVIVVDDASVRGDALRAEAEAAGARYLRRDVRGGAGAARNTGLAAASHELVACVDSDCVPRPGWLDVLLPHFADPELCAIAPRIVALDDQGVVGRYEASRSPLDRGPVPGRVIPYGRVPFVPGAALVVRRHLRFDETLRGGEDVELVWRLPYVRYEPTAQVAHDHRTDPGAWLARRIYYGRTAAGIARKHPGNARPLHVSPWTTAAWLALAARRPVIALGITATATALLARDVDAATATRLAALGTLRSGRVVADALTRHWWPLSAAAAILFPRTRLPLAAAALADPSKLPDDLAYGFGLWLGCIEHRNPDPLLPARPWRLRRGF
jgi:mycofactocin glycosyltransferase